MLGNALLIRFVAVLAGLVILAAMPRQTDATDDSRNVSFEERWQTVPRYGEFICGFKPEVKVSSLGKSKTPYVTKPPSIPLPRGLGRQRRDVFFRGQSADKGGMAVIEDPAEGIFGTRPDPYAKRCAIGLDSDAPQCANK